MKEKTLNAQRPTSNARLKTDATPVIEWAADGVRVNELPTANYGATREVRRYDLEDRLLDFAVSIVELTDSFPTTRAGNHIAGQLLRCGTSPLSNHGEVEASRIPQGFSSQATNLPERTTRDETLAASGQPVEKLWTPRGSSRLP